MQTYLLIVDPSANGSANLAEALAKIGQVDMISQSEIYVTAEEKDVLKVALEYPQAVMKFDAL